MTHRYPVGTELRGTQIMHAVRRSWFGTLKISVRQPGIRHSRKWRARRGRLRTKILVHDLLLSLVERLERDASQD